MKCEDERGVARWVALHGSLSLTLNPMTKYREPLWQAISQALYLDHRGADPTWLGCLVGRVLLSSLGTLQVAQSCHDRPGPGVEFPRRETRKWRISCWPFCPRMCCCYLVAAGGPWVLMTAFRWVSSIMSGRFPTFPTPCIDELRRNGVSRMPDTFALLLFACFCFDCI